MSGSDSHICALKSQFLHLLLMHQLIVQLLQLVLGAGLEYLHVGCTPSLIHRDVKSSNILLSAKYDAKVADFGLSKLMGNDASVMTLVKGTPGYIDPE